MLTELRILLKEITDLERSLKRKGDHESLRKMKDIKKRIKILIVEEMQK